MVKKIDKNGETTFESDDISVDRKAVVKVIGTEKKGSYVAEVRVSMFVIPNRQRDMGEYCEQIGRIVSRSKRLLRDYISSNQDLFYDMSIMDINFTSANLRKGYNKSVQMSLFARMRNPDRFTRVRKNIKDTIKDTVNMITSKIAEEDFRCFKRKQSINKRIVGITKESI